YHLILYPSAHPLSRHSFPTRRSSDLFTAVMFNLLWLSVKKVLKPGVPRSVIEAINRSYLLGPPISAAALVIAFVNPTIGILVIAGLMILYMLPRSSGT